MTNETFLKLYTHNTARVVFTDCVAGKVMFSQAYIILFTGVCVVYKGCDIEGVSA